MSLPQVKVISSGNSNSASMYASMKLGFSGNSADKRKKKKERGFYDRFTQKEKTAKHTHTSTIGGKKN